MDSYFRWFGLPGSAVLTGLLSAFSLILALIDPTPARWVCFAAMALSSVGDLFLARFMGLDRIFPNYFLIGACFFMAAHLVYILCYAMKIQAAGAAFFNAGVVIAAVLGTALMTLLFVLCVKKGNLKSLVLILIYGIIIFSNCATVFSHAWSQGGHSFRAVLGAVGALSFLLSDLVIGLGIAGDVHRYDFLIWWLYPIGQLLLIIAA